jgi:hypothetical protein
VAKLALNQLQTIKLIERYYLDLLKTQNEVSECKYGILNLRAYYNANSETLVVDGMSERCIFYRFLFSDWRKTNHCPGHERIERSFCRD